MIRFTEEQKMILNCYEGGKIKVILRGAKIYRRTEKYR